MTKFSVCTYNVHCFTDGNGKDNFDRVVEVLTTIKPDLLCLQECTMHKYRKLKTELGYKNAIQYRNVVLMTDFDIEEWNYIQSIRGRPRYVTAKVRIDPDQDPFFITSCHLNHFAEPKRMVEIR